MFSSSSSPVFSSTFSGSLAVAFPVSLALLFVVFAEQKALVEVVALPKGLEVAVPPPAAAAAPNHEDFPLPALPIPANPPPKLAPPNPVDLLVDAAAAVEPNPATDPKPKTFLFSNFSVVAEEADKTVDVKGFAVAASVAAFVFSSFLLVAEVSLVALVATAVVDADGRLTL